MLYYGLLLCAALVFLFSCRPYGNCHEFYEFYFAVSASPQDTFVVGDTIWIEMDIPNQLINHQTGEEVDLSDFELVLSFSVGKVDSTILVTGASHLNLFEVVEEVGALKDQTIVFTRHRLHLHSIAEKRCRIGLVSTEPGTYVVGLSMSPHYEEVYEPRGLSKNNCYEHFLEHTRVVVNEGVTNFYLVENICQYNREGTRYCYRSLDNEDGRYNGYYFHVKEP